MLSNMDGCDILTEIEDLKKKKDEWLEKSREYRETYDMLKQSVAKELVVEGFLSGKTFFLYVEKHKMVFVDEFAKVDDRLRMLLSLESNLHHNETIYYHLNLTQGTKTRVQVLFRINRIEVSYSPDITVEDFACLLDELKITHIYFDKYYSDRIKRDYMLAELVRNVCVGKGVKLSTRLGE